MSGSRHTWGLPSPVSVSLPDQFSAGGEGKVLEVSDVQYSPPVVYSFTRRLCCMLLASPCSPCPHAIIAPETPGRQPVWAGSSSAAWAYLGSGNGMCQVLQVVGGSGTSGLLGGWGFG